MLKTTCLVSSIFKRNNLRYFPARFIETDVIQSLNSTDNSLRDESEFSLSSNHSSAPVIIPCRPDHPNRYIAPRQAWITNLDTVEEEKLGLLELHPSVFATMPRMDLIFQNLRWQRCIHFVDFKSDKSRADMPGSGRKPWPQKGTGRARHGSLRSPIFLKGGKAHAKWGPKTHFYMLPLAVRLHGLTGMLTCKLAQDDLVIVDSLEIPTDKSKFIEDVIEKRKWGASVLIINHSDIMPRNISLATDKMESVTLMPYYGLNVYSMLKYDTLVVTQEALSKIEERLLFNLNRIDLHHTTFDRFKVNQSVPYYNS